jgi:hypothetical protein
MPTALQGAVIIKKDGLKIQYRKKCESCGHVDNSTSSTSVSASSSSKLVSSFRCTKCHNNQRIEILGGLG